MAMRVSKSIVGVDVAKVELVIYEPDQDLLTSITNDKPTIKRWLKTLPRPAAVAVEATNVYHIDLIELAHEAGLDVYIIDGYQLSNYRKSVGVRSKTDASDARLLARYLKNEGEDLHPWTPPPAVYGKLQSLLRRRASLVQAKTSLTQSWANDASLKAVFATFLKSVERLDLLVQKKLKDVLREAGLLEEVARCQAIEGIGFLTATALVMAYNRGDFKSSDSFIAFLGMDLRVSDSGQKNGRRSLTKRGCSEVRRLLHNAAMSACRSSTWKGFYNEHLSSGKATTQVLVMLSRKLARIAFSLMKNQSEYQPKGLIMA
ncbi:IS110 family transposase [Pseudomonas triticifolii]|uniref:Transposase n=3 Tax=Pseudomonas TaxID=286 RepID=A0ABR7BEW2_9PSED|nr:transposase [Pseudomonas triticifolii]MBC3955683.1 transposase [Pseudomonas triticifolii]MBC3955684.1 transposase [Pseudomonas triticifolii]